MEKSEKETNSVPHYTNTRPFTFLSGTGIGTGTGTGTSMKKVAGLSQFYESKLPLLLK